MINYHIEGLYKTQTKSNFSHFFFSHWLLHKCFFSFLIKVFANFEKLIRFHWQAFIVYKNGENLKMLIEIFCQKLIVSNVILAFLDYLKSKIFFVGQSCRPTLSATPVKYNKNTDILLFLTVIYYRATWKKYWKNICECRQVKNSGGWEYFTAISTES